MSSRSRPPTLARSVEDDHAARDRPFEHQPEPLVDLVEPVGPADQTVEIDAFSRSRSARIGKSILGRTDP